jgi:uncharacterized protein (DUF58 family)
VSTPLGEGVPARGSGPRPGRVGRPSVVLAGLGGAFFAIARTTGSGWVTVLLCGVVGCLGVGAFWPLVSVSRVAVSVTAARDATVDQSLVVGLAVTAGGGLRVRMVEPSGDWASAEGPSRGEVVVTPSRRGVFDAVTVEVATAAPVGLFWWRRVLRAPLAVPLEVGPRRLQVSLEDLPWTGVAGLAEATGRRAGHDMVRSVRPYVPGDAARLVHWPATARWGDLMVKEMEDPELPHVAIVADLRFGGGRAEEAASRAAGLAEAALDRGVPVWLLTAERNGGMAAEVVSSRQVGQRLARAVGGAPPDGPVPAGSVIVRVDR